MLARSAEPLSLDSRQTLLITRSHPSATIRAGFGRAVLSNPNGATQGQRARLRIEGRLALGGPEPVRSLARPPLGVEWGRLEPVG
jgi:hypothetical protein